MQNVSKGDQALRPGPKCHQSACACFPPSLSSPLWGYSLNSLADTDSALHLACSRITLNGQQLIVTEMDHYIRKTPCLLFGAFSTFFMLFMKNVEKA